MCGQRIIPYFDKFQAAGGRELNSVTKRVPAQLMGPDGGPGGPDFSKKTLETVFEASYDGIYITDGDAVTIMINKSYESITGLKREDMLGKRMHDLVKAQTISQSGTLAALEKREPVTLEQVFKTGKHAIITSTPIFDEGGRVAMVVTNVRDITELNYLQKELEESWACNLQYYSELEILRRKVGRAPRLVAQDPAMQAVLRVADKAAELDIPILLEGETGTGKQDFARYIASRSRRKKEKFIEVNCSAYSEEELEFELFGSAPSPQAKSGTMGLLELASGGTILLQEVGELPAKLQMRLVRLLRSGLVTRVGDGKPCPVDIRIIASTTQDLKRLVEGKKFREELYYGLNVLPIQMLPLRQRKEDIIPLVEEMCIELNKKHRQKKRFSHMALLTLKSYAWPGNLRELRNVVESAMILCGGDIIEPRDLPICTEGTLRGREAEELSGPVDLRRIVEDLELKYIRSAYRLHGNVRDAAKSLGMDPSTFVRKRKKLEGRDG